MYDYQRIDTHKHTKYRNCLPLWRVAIKQVLHKTGRLPPVREPYIIPFTEGKNPVFWVEGKYVVKFFSDQFSSEEGWRNEISVLKMLKRVEVPNNFPLQFPKLLSKGYLYEKSDPWLKEGGERRWKWPFTIQKFVRGQALKQVWNDLSQQERIHVASYLGEALRIIHQTSHVSENISEFSESSRNWTNFEDFLKMMRLRCIKRFKKEHVLNSIAIVIGIVVTIVTSSCHGFWISPLLSPFFKLVNGFLEKAVTTYLPKQVGSLFLDLKGSSSFSSVPSLLHCDVTPENVLGNFDGGTEEWSPVGLIDFGDAKLGDILYDLVVIHIELFKCDKMMTYHFMDSYGIEFWKRKNFAYRAMCYSILTEQEIMTSIWETKPTWKVEFKSWGHLETILWDFSFYHPFFGETYEYSNTTRKR
eukprot:TRINITY_DN7208_c0_g1_i1.p1 TRINITY_DN7208_c0_g1~~TRINITY_DN7208_c0_g1_i1.p1  ORF type:complete len:429 (+),score=85.51 TRINITY_DN7208_c0_g1_i1:43-1287(+)